MIGRVCRGLIEVRWALPSSQTMFRESEPLRTLRTTSMPRSRARSKGLALFYSASGISIFGSALGLDVSRIYLYIQLETWLPAK